MKRFKVGLATLIVALFGVVALVPVASVAAYDPLAAACENGGSEEICNDKTTTSDLFTNIVNTLLFIVGALSVVMIIVAGVLYTTSSGDSGRVSRAKNTMTYAIVGLIVSLLAYAIVNWVLKIFS